MKIKKFLQKLEGSTIGCFSKTNDSSFVEAMAVAGLDFIILDMEHGPISTDVLKHHIMALKGTDTLGLVRVEGHDSHLIGKALDLGADGIQVPSISSFEQAREVLKQAKFHPAGERGVCRFVRAAEYSNTEKKEYFIESNKSLVILQLEGKQGLEAFDQIIELEGVDIIFIGPYDLSQSLGVPGEIEHSIVVEEISKMVEKAAARNVKLGTFCDSVEQYTKWKKHGMNYLAYSVDIGLFLDKLKEIKSLNNES